MTWLINEWQWLAGFVVALVSAYLAYKSIKKTDPIAETKDINKGINKGSAKVAVIKAKDNSRVSVKQ